MHNNKNKNKMKNLAWQIPELYSDMGNCEVSIYIYIKCPKKLLEKLTIWYWYHVGVFEVN